MCVMLGHSLLLITLGALLALQDITARQLMQSQSHLRQL
jgi:hypothetical protein